MYIADTLNNRIRKVNLNHGYLFDMAGNGEIGDEDRLATNSKFNNPYDVIVDSNEDVFFADKDNNKIKKIGGLTQLILILF